MIVSEWLNAEERDRFRRGLRHLDTHAEAVTGTGFADAGEMGQTAILTGLEAEGRALEERDPDAPTHTAGVPGRHELDDTQELNYRGIARAIADLEFEGFLAHEFIPTRDPLTSIREAAEVCRV